MQNYTVVSFISKTTSTMKPFISATLQDEQGALHERVAIWSNFPGYSAIKPNGTVFGEVKDNGKGLSLQVTNAGPQQRGNNSAAIGLAQERKGEMIREAQGNKETGIKLAAAMRDSAMVVTTLFADIIQKIPEAQRTDKIKEELINWRTWFLDEWESERRTMEGETAF